MNVCRCGVLLIALFVQPVIGQDEEPPKELKFDTPPSPVERAAAARLSRLRSVRMWWGDKNHVLGVSLKGSDANDQAIASARELSQLRSLVLVALADNRLTDQGMAPIVGLPRLELLSITASQLGDPCTAYIGQLKSLRTLILNGSFTDQGMPNLASLDQLEQLDLTQTEVTHKGLQSLPPNPKLATLILNGTKISNPAITDLHKKFPNLTALCLDHTAIDDGAVEGLTSMAKLKTLIVRHTGITETGLNALQQAFTDDCTIIHHFRTGHGEREESIPIAQADPPVSNTGWQAVHRER